MPRYKNSSGCYNREDARRYGLTVAVVWNDILDRAEHFDVTPMWYDQQQASERLGIPRQTINRAVKVLQVEGRLKAKVGYRPNSTTKTTWIEVLAEETEMDGKWLVEVAEEAERLGDILNAQNEHSKNAQNEHSILNDTEERDSGQNVSPVTVFLRVNPSGKAWKSQRVYSTQEEVDTLESTDPDDNINFKFWKSPKMVGDDSKAKFKRMKAKLIQPDVEEDDEDKEERWNPYADQ